MEVNPYQSPLIDRDSGHDQITVAFEGLIDKEMYARLLPNERWFFQLFGVLLGFVVMPLDSVMLFYGVFVARDWVPILGATFLFSVFIGPLIYCWRYPSNIQKAERNLREFQDLVGPVKGIFSSNGLVLWDGPKVHWFPWALICRLHIMKEGVRVPLEGDHRRFLALGSQLFEHNPRMQLAMLRRSYRPRWLRNDELVNLSATVFQKSTNDPGYYAGGIYRSNTTQTWFEMFVGPTAIALSVPLLTVFRGWNGLTVPFLLLFIALTVPSIPRMIGMIRNRGLTIHSFWGWLGDDELIQGTGLHVLKFPLDGASVVVLDPDTIEVKHPQVASTFLFRSQFPNKDLFDAIRDKEKSDPEE